MSLYTPKKEHRFSFGLWCTANRGRDPFGEETRSHLDPIENIKQLAKRNAYAFNYHDDDLIPFGSSEKARNKIIKQTKKVMKDYSIKCGMATTNLFGHRVFKDGAFTSHDPKIRAFALKKVMRNIDLGVELGAKIYVFWGGREGAEVDAAKDPMEAIKRYRECMNFLCGYVKHNHYDLKFAIEPKPNEPRGDIYLATSGHVLGFIETLDHPEMVGVNPEIEHTIMAGLNPYHDFAQCMEAGKLFHVDLGAQKANRFDQDLRFGSEDFKSTFFVVKLLEDNNWQGTRNFDEHPYRTASNEETWEFITGSMRTYLILMEKVKQFNKDKTVQQILSRLNVQDAKTQASMSFFSPDNADAIRDAKYDLAKISERRLYHEALDQRLVEILAGV